MLRVICGLWLSHITAKGIPVERSIKTINLSVFFMWVSETPEKVSIWRFMVDQRFQKAGIGRAALNLALNEIKVSDKVKEIEICYDLENPVAKDFYSSFGFQEVCMDENGEDMLALIKL